MSSLDYLDLCRLCLVKDRVSVPIFEGEGDVRQIFLKIAACLPVKLTREDKLPKKICDDCVYKVELFYQFWNTTANAEKQLLQWLGEVSLEDKQGYVTNVLNTSVMKQEQNSENRLDGNVMQQVGEHQNNMGMAMMDNMGLGIPMMISSANQQQITSVPMDTNSNTVQTVQAVPGPSSQTTHNQIPQNQTSTTQQEDEEESSDDDENSDEDCDGDEGLPVKEESEEDPSNRTIEPTTFVNVSLACDEAGPSGLQQQKIADMPEMPIPQPTDGDPKSGNSRIAEKLKPPNPTQQLILLCRRIPDQKNINRVPLDLKANSISERNAKKRRRFVSGSKKMNKSRTLKKSESNLTDSTTQNGTNVDLISKENIMSTSDCSNLVNSDSSLIETNNDTVGKIPDDHKINTVKRALISAKNPVTNEIKKMLVPTESTNTGRLNVIKNILIPVYDKSGVISNMKKVVLPIKQKSNLYETSKEDSKMLIIDNIMQQMGNMQKEDTSTISIENELEGLENSKNPVAQITLNESRVQCTEYIKDQSEMEEDKHAKEILLDFLKGEIEEEKERQDETESQKFPILETEDETEALKFPILETEDETESLKFPDPETEDEEMNEVLGNLETIYPVCQRVCKNVILLQRHIHRFHKMIHSCDKCNKWYPSKLLLEKHKITHEDYPYLQCSTCHLKYKRKAGLKYHHIRMHSNVESKFMCDHCGKRLKLKIDLVGHVEKTHLNARHVCKICGKVVENITHHKWQHDKTAKRNAFKYSCDVCRKKFSTHNHLDNHLLMHKDGFKFTLCDEVFSSPYSLSSHKIVKQRRSSTCTICERSFPSTTNFYQHVLTHEGIRPYKCDICGEDFTQRSSVLRHRKTHPGPLPPFRETTSIADIAKNILMRLSNA